MTKESENLDAVRTRHAVLEYIEDNDDGPVTLVGHSRENGVRFSRGFPNIREAQLWVTSYAGSSFIVTSVHRNTR
jgi:hypothetical protein